MSTNICNTGLGLLGSGTDVQFLTDYETDTSRTAIAARRLFPRARDKALVAHEWNEAIATVAGEDAGADVEDFEHLQYDYAYQIPEDPPCLKFLRIVDEDGKKLKHEVRDGYILCDYETDEFWYQYIYDPGEGDYSEELQMVMAYYFAVFMASPVIKGEDGDKKRLQLWQELREIALPDAKIADLEAEWDEHNENLDAMWVDTT